MRELIRRRKYVVVTGDAGLGGGFDEAAAAPTSFPH